MMMATTKSKMPMWCVCQTGWNDGETTNAVGDGITSPTRLLISYHYSEAEAARELERLVATFPPARKVVAGGRYRRPLLEVGAFAPLDFVAGENRDNYSSETRRNILTGQLLDECVDRRRAILDGSACRNAR